MNEAPVVSIAIRAWRRESLPAAIASALAQTWRDLELVIYDDRGSLEDLARASGDPRVRYYRAEQRFDASGRFAAAVARCRGRYIGLLDDDDRYEPAFVARLVESLEGRPDAGIAFCRVAWESSRGRVEPIDHRPAGLQPNALADMLSDGWTVTPSSMLIRRAALDDAERVQAMPDGVAPDVFVNLRVALAGWRHVLVDGRLVTCGWSADQA